MPNAPVVPPEAGTPTLRGVLVRNPDAGIVGGLELSPATGQPISIAPQVAFLPLHGPVVMPLAVTKVQSLMHSAEVARVHACIPAAASIARMLLRVLAARGCRLRRRRQRGGRPPHRRTCLCVQGGQKRMHSLGAAAAAAAALWLERSMSDCPDDAACNLQLQALIGTATIGGFAKMICQWHAAQGRQPASRKWQIVDSSFRLF